MPLLPKVVFNYKVCTIYNKWNILIFIMNKLIKDYKIYLAMIVVDRLIRENELNYFKRFGAYKKRVQRHSDLIACVCVHLYLYFRDGHQLSGAVHDAGSRCDTSFCYSKCKSFTAFILFLYSLKIVYRLYTV